MGWNFGLINVLEELRAEFQDAKPMVLHQMVLVSAWNADEGDEDEDFQIQFKLALPGGEIKELAHNVKIAGERARLFEFVQGLSLKEPGTLKIDLALNGKHAASHTIHVRAAET